MKQRRTRIVDRSFQLRTVFSITLFAMAGFAVLIAAIVFVSIDTRAEIADGLHRLNDAIETQDNIVSAFVDYAAGARGRPVKISIDIVKSDHAKSMETLRGHAAGLGRVAAGYFRIILAAVGVALLLAGGLFAYLIRVTHRIAGPVYVMTRHVQDMIEGREPHFRDLREKDEFKELYGKLAELAGKMRGGGSG